MTDFRLDWQRAERTGTREAVLCDAKSASQIAAIVAHAIEIDERLLLTRLATGKHAKLPPHVRSALDFDDASRTAVLGGMPAPAAAGRVAIVTGGTSDARVAREAARTLAFEGERATMIADVGVAGLWRLLERVDEIRTHRVVVAVAGMEGALFSVIAGLVPCPVVAVPTSTGYGMARRGRTALQAALASCASGLCTVNIDNGFGAAHVALRMLNMQTARERTSKP